MQLSRKIKYYFRKRRKINILEKTYLNSNIRTVFDIEKNKLDFNPSTNPKVTIIIPFYNQLDYTWNCLNHLHTHLTDKISYEILLIDDNSSENCDLSEITGIRIIKNTENKGFLKNINIGIKSSLGEYIYILNNDTEVQKGFLEELFYVFESFPNVGAVGSKLINADGSLQEAGSVFMKDCTIHQIVRKKEVYYPQVNYIYKVDYCSGCSLLFKKQKDNGDLNLFDEYFAPAYFEETDFCFQIKHLQNKEVYYTPFSVVLHFNGVTYNAPKNIDTAKIKQKEELFKLNLEKFKNKWQPQINAIQATSVETRIEEIYHNKEVVFFCSIIPEHDQDSGSNRFKEIIQAFSRIGYSVSLIKKKTFLNDNKYIEFFQRLGVNVYYEHHKSIDIEKYLKKNNANATIAWFYNPDVFVEYYKVAKKCLKKAKLVYDMVDIHHLRYERALELDPKNISFKKKYTQYKKLETISAKEADLVVTISDFEKKYMNQFCDQKKMITISNIHDIKIQKEKTLPFEERKDILFIGSNHTPNIDALYYLYNEIMPIVWKEIPDLIVNIIGNVNKEITDINDPKFIFKGYVPNIEEYFLANKFMIAPLRYGAGVKGKIGQAFEYHLPLVTSPIGSEGMHLVHKKNALIANSNEEFAAAIIELYTNKQLWIELQNNSEQSLKPFSKEVLEQTLSLFNKTE
ncbi:glycosyltransferase [Flavobacterium nackdongense]|uniref:Glycosyltransferase n=1 Tax=Flavobacterium nackdongense TaxID=2547394 RepID=A0A4P6YI07_9FLAO|nr:glycosyltransferase [Flavobacterium nackdongense]QBN20210.1 glycosyltransferase [Flavobacterium nackdongense]